MDQKCWECGKEASISFGQVVSGEKLFCFRSLRCSECGAAIEEDRHGLDEEVRGEVLRRDGEWLLLVDDVSLRVKGMVVVKECLGVRYDWFAELKGVDERCVGNGTRAEMEWISRLMKKSGVGGSVVRGS